MNRIILIGNGFDLAHRLETSYKHFIDDYWGNVAKSLKEKGGYSDDHVEISPMNNNILSSVYLPETLKLFFELRDKSYKGIKDFLQSHKWSIKEENNFLKKISDECSFKNWVDIEKEYYVFLKECMKKKGTLGDILTLNKEFESIKKLLEKYLSGINIEDILLNDDIYKKIVGNFKFKDFSQEYQRKYIKDQIKYIASFINKSDSQLQSNEINIKNELNKRNHSDPKEIEKLLSRPDTCNFFPDVLPVNFLLVNFNYTSTSKLYHNGIQGYLSDYFNLNIPREYIKSYVNVHEIHIHGELNNKINPIIFGFGDEIDEDYSRIENLDDNRYLENIKSTKYHETDNYKKLLEYIDSDYFQIFIFGHSCGLSDRTLLSTLFNHSNCISIKPFYYIKEDGSDNYSDLVRNISRHFKNKAHLRDKVVNKTYCEPLTGSK